MNLAIDTLRTMTLMILAFNSQAVFYVAGERERLWSSRPNVIVILSLGVEFLIIATLVVQGILMALSPAKSVNLAYDTTAL
jgi:H+-transporting ATPase